MLKELYGYNVRLTSPINLPPYDLTPEMIQIAVLHFKLPFVILIPGGLSTNEAVPEMQSIAVVGDKASGELRFLKRINKDQEQWGAVLASEDIFGEYSYSIGQIVLKANNDQLCSLNDLICNEQNKIDPDKLVSIATDLISKFIDSYKIVNKNTKDWIPEITIARLSPWHRMHAVNFQGDTIWTQEVLDYRGTGIMLGSNLNDVQLREMQRLCINRVHSSMVNKYISLANRHKRMRDFHSFCVLGVVAIEHWLFAEIRKVLLFRDNTVEDVDRKFFRDTRSGQQKIIAREDAIKLVTGDKNFKNKSEYTDYIEKVVSKRDSIVHART